MSFFLIPLLLAFLLSGFYSQSSTEIGVMPQGEDPLCGAYAEALMQNENYTFRFYTDQSEMEQALLKGKLHCAYLVTLQDARMEKPVEAIATEGSYMRPITDEVILSAYLDTMLPQIVQQYLARDGEEVALSSIRQRLTDLRENGNLLTIRVEQAGQEPIRENEKAVLYWSLVWVSMLSLFAVIVPLDMMLSARGGETFWKGIARAGRGFSNAVARVAADLLFWLAALLVCDLLTGALMQGAGYAWSTRLPALIGYSVVILLAGTVLTKLFQKSFLPWIIVSPVLLLIGIVFSGCLIDPAALPGIGFLRFLSPAWYLLQMFG